MPAGAGDACYLEFDGVPLRFEAITLENAEHVSEVTEHAVEMGADVADHVRAKNPKVSFTALVSNTPIRDVNDWYGQRDESVTLNVPTANKKSKTVQLDVPKPALAAAPGALVSAAAALLSGGVSYSVTYEELQGYVSSGVSAQVRKFPGLGRGGSVVLDTIVLLEEWRTKAVIGKAIFPWGTYENMLITKVTPKRSPSTGDAAEISIDLQGIRLVESKLVTAPVPTEVRGKVAVAKGRQPTSPVTPAVEARVQKSVAKATADKLRR